MKNQNAFLARFASLTLALSLLTAPVALLAAEGTLTIVTSYPKDTTGTFKMVKGDLRKEAYDLEQVTDALYVMLPGGTTYQKLDAATAETIRSGMAGY